MLKLAFNVQVSLDYTLFYKKYMLPIYSNVTRVRYHVYFNINVEENRRFCVRIFDRQFHFRLRSQLEIGHPENGTVVLSFRPFIFPTFFLSTQSKSMTVAALLRSIYIFSLFNFVINMVIELAAQSNNLNCQLHSPNWEIKNASQKSLLANNRSYFQPSHAIGYKLTIVNKNF